MMILGVPGSLRRDSYNRRLLAAAARELPPTATLDVFDHLAAIPPYSDDHPVTDAVVTLRAAIDAADGVLIATPEYNSSVPGQLKNALDWASRPFPDNALRGKPVAVIGASTGLFGAVWAQAELRKILKTIGARVGEGDLAVGQANDAFGTDGRLAELEHRDALVRIVEELRRMAPHAGSFAGSVEAATQSVNVEACVTNL